ncbi:MAG: hypothetical protein AAFY71_09690 [Bacteroidota bacterium]
MTKSFSLLILCMLLTAASFAQDISSWDLLADVRFPTSIRQQRLGDYGEPIFGTKIQAKAGQEITIKGYMLPITVDNEKFILSQFPFQDCFFCGGAGKETVIELDFEKLEDFPIDEPVYIKGRLELVPVPHELCYRIVDAKWVKK